MLKDYQVGDRIECDLSFTAYTVSDAPDGFIAGVASTPITDLYGHKVLAGAFDDSIRVKGLNKGPGIKLLLGHDWHKPAGIIKRLETKNDKLEIEAQLSLKSGYVRDLYEVAKDIGGLNFSVGFMLEEFEFVDEDQEKSVGVDDAWLIVKKGDLMEVSVVCFPACVEAQMTHIKSIPNTLAEFEKALVADKFCRSREQAKRLTLVVKNSLHLFTGQKPPGGAPTDPQPHPWLDAHRLEAAVDLTAKVKALFSPR